MKRVLVIDDDVDVGAAIRMILESQRFETTLAYRAHSGIHALEGSSFDVVQTEIRWLIDAVRPVGWDTL